MYHQFHHATFFMHSISVVFRNLSSSMYLSAQMLQLPSIVLCYYNIISQRAAAADVANKMLQSISSIGEFPSLDQNSSSRNSPRQLHAPYIQIRQQPFCIVNNKEYKIFYTSFKHQLKFGKKLNILN